MFCVRWVLKIRVTRGPPFQCVLSHKVSDPWLYTVVSVQYWVKIADVSPSFNQRWADIEAAIYSCNKPTGK